MINPVRDDFRSLRRPLTSGVFWGTTVSMGLVAATKLVFDVALPSPWVLALIVPCWGIQKLEMAHEKQTFSSRVAQEMSNRRITKLTGMVVGIALSAAIGSGVQRYHVEMPSLGTMMPKADATPHRPAPYVLPWAKINKDWSEP